MCKWVPIYTGRRHRRCATRRHKTHNKKAIRYTRKHGPWWPNLLAGEIGRMFNVTILDN